MATIANIGRGLARGALAVLQTPATISYGKRSLQRQLSQTPFSITRTRAGQVLSGRSPMIYPLWKAEESVMALLSLNKGVLEISKLWPKSAKAAIEKQGIEKITVTDFNSLMFGPQRAMVVLKRAAAGMEEGKEYFYTLQDWSPSPDSMSMIRRGSEVTVISRES